MTCFSWWNSFMSLSFLRANEIHLFIDNKIWVIDRKVVQSCRIYKLSNQFCYVAMKIFEKCVSCAILSKIIKKCEVVFIEYVKIHSFHDDFVNATSFSIFDSMNDFFVALVFFKFFMNSVVTTASRSLWNLIEDETCFFVSTSCDDDRTHAKKTMLVKKMKRRISILKEDNCRLTQRVIRLKIIFEQHEKNNSIEWTINWLDKNFLEMNRRRNDWINIQNYVNASRRDDS